MREVAYENHDAPRKRHCILFTSGGVYSRKPRWLRFSALLSGFTLPR